MKPVAFGVAIGSTIAAGAIAAVLCTPDAEPVAVQPFEDVIQLDLTSILPEQKQIPFEIVLQPDALPPWTHAASIDFNGDGGADVHIESRPGHGVLSTYWIEYRIVALGPHRLLKAGAPLEHGTQLCAADFVDASTEAWLATVGGSLRYPDRDGSEFSGGPWYRAMHKLLAVAVINPDRAGIGWAEISVSDQGEVTVHGTHVTWLPNVTLDAKD